MTRTEAAPAGGTLSWAVHFRGLSLGRTAHLTVIESARLMEPVHSQPVSCFPTGTPHYSGLEPTSRACVGLFVGVYLTAEIQPLGSGGAQGWLFVGVPMELECVGQ